MRNHKRECIRKKWEEKTLKEEGPEQTSSGLKRKLESENSEALPASDYLSLSRYLSFFSFTSQTLSDI